MTQSKAQSKFTRAAKKAKRLYKTGKYRKYSDAVKAAYKTIGAVRKKRKQKRKPATKSGGLQLSNNKSNTMARRRKSSRRRRRVGAVAMNANSPLVKYAPPVVGYLVGDTNNTQVDKLFTNVTDTTKKALYEKIAHASMLALWAWYAFGRKGQKNPMPLIALGILGGAGLKGLMADLNVGIAGFQQVPVVSGYQQVPVVGSYGATQSRTQLNGIGAYDIPGSMGAYSAGGSSVMNGIGSISNEAAGLMRQD
jgi:hypothetical protein